MKIYLTHYDWLRIMTHLEYLLKNRIYMQMWHSFIHSIYIRVYTQINFYLSGTSSSSWSVIRKLTYMSLLSWILIFLIAQNAKNHKNISKWIDPDIIFRFTNRSFSKFWNIPHEENSAWLWDSCSFYSLMRKQFAD